MNNMMAYSIRGSTKILARAMSQVYNIPIEKVLKPRDGKFIDSLRIKFEGGKGGDGCISMLHEWCREFGGPDGGNGGNGGHIVLRADSKTKSLNGLAAKYKGLPGSSGKGKNLYGKNADHTFVNVPIGTLVCKPHYLRTLPDDQYEPEESEVVAELDEQDSMFIAARGGAGGRGNHSYWSDKNRHPRVAQSGALGDINEYDIRIRVYAHFGLIGFPNAGKSSLLKSLTNANAKIGDYCFTTKFPQVGVLIYENDYSQVAISDLPGLIFESSKNRGLGVRFLRHAQKCACLIYVIDLSTNPIEQMTVLTNEIEQFRKGMSRRPHIIVGNKIDHPLSIKNMAAFEKFLENEWQRSRFIPVSCSRGNNLELLRQQIRVIYDSYRDKLNDGLDSSLSW